MRNAAFIATILTTSVAFSAHALTTAVKHASGQLAKTVPTVVSEVPWQRVEPADSNVILAGNAAKNGVKKQVKRKENKVKPKPDSKNKRKSLFKKNEMREKTLGTDQSLEGGANTGLKTRDGKPVKLQSE